MEQWWSKVVGVAILGAILSTGCALPSSSIVYRGDEAFTPAERAEIERGAALLSLHTGHDVAIVWDLPHEGAAPLRSIRRIHLPSGVGEAQGYRLALDADSANLSGGSMLARLSAHEMGHALGLDHVDVDGAIMSAGVSSAPLTWSPADEAECRRVGVCSGAE